MPNIFARRGSSNEYPQAMLGKEKKNPHTPVLLYKKKVGV